MKDAARLIFSSLLDSEFFGLEGVDFGTRLGAGAGEGTGVGVGVGVAVL